MAINYTTKIRRIQFIETRILGSCEDAIWMARNELSEDSKKKELSSRGCLGYPIVVAPQNVKKAEILATNIF